MTVGFTNCSRCGAPNATDKRFCTACGRKIEVPEAQTGSSDEQDLQGVRSPKGFNWTIAISLFLILAAAGAGLGFFLGSRGEDYSEPNPGAGREGQGQANNKGPLPQVLCREGTFGDFTLTLKARPRECELLAKGSQVDQSTSATAYIRNLEWIEWGLNRALARGSYFIPSVGPRPAVIQLLETKEVCGEMVYTQFSVSLAESQPQSGRSLRIEGCLPDDQSGASSRPEFSTGETNDPDFDTGQSNVAEVPPAAADQDAFIIRPDQSCPSGWEKQRNVNNQTGLTDTSCQRLED